MTTASEQVGRSARQRAPRSAHAAWEAAPDRVDAIATLEHQAETRTPELVPVRYGRMARSPFAFLRGAAAIMAADLAPPPSPDCARSCAETRTWRTSAPSPHPIAPSSSISTTSTRRCPVRGSGTSSAWRRASWSRGAIAASMRRHSATSSRPACGPTARPCAASPRCARSTSGTPALDVERQVADWGRRLDADRRKQLGRAVAKARRKNSLRALSKLTYRVDGAPRIVSDPPLIVPVEELLGAEDTAPDLARLVGSSATTAGRCPPTSACSRRATSRSTSHTRSSASAAWARARGSS